MTELSKLEIDLHLLIKDIYSARNPSLHVTTPADRAQIVDALIAAGYRKQEPDAKPPVDEDPVQHDPVNRPKHYVSHPSGIECIQVTEHMGFNLGNAVKYAWRADLKSDALGDLRKAVWYIEREIQKREKA